MIPTPFGLIAIAIASFLLFRATPLGLLRFMMCCTLFGGSAAFIVTALGNSSILPAHLALVFLVARILLPGSGAYNAIGPAIRSNIFLTFYALYSAATAFLLPRIFAGHIAVVPQLDAAPVLQARRGDSLPRKLELVLGEGDPGRIDAVVLRRVDRQPAPAATDVEKPVAGSQAQLAADVVELLRLSGIDVLGAGTEVRARVDHPGIQPQLVERVGHIIMAMNRLASHLARVPG